MIKSTFISELIIFLTRQPAIAIQMRHSALNLPFSIIVLISIFPYSTVLSWMIHFKWPLDCLRFVFHPNYDFNLSVSRLVAASRLSPICRTDKHSKLSIQIHIIRGNLYLNFFSMNTYSKTPRHAHELSIIIF